MQRMIFAALLGLLTLAFAAHCGDVNDVLGTETDDSSGQSGTSEDTDASDPLSSETPSTDPDTVFVSNTDTEEKTCDTQAINIQFVPTRLIVLSDLSGSMNDTTGDSKESKWELAHTALRSMLNNPANAAIEFGFDSFPVKAGASGADGCQVGTKVHVDTAPNQQATLAASLNALSPEGGTPLCKAMMNFDVNRHPRYAPKFMASGAAQYLLIVSDGMDTCGDPNHPLLCGTSEDPGVENSNITQAMFSARTKDLLDHQIKTYVVGFDGKGAMATQLNAIAAAGGTERSTFINVTSQAELQAALDGIAEKVKSCTFTINKPSAAADPEKVNFEINGTTVKRDDTCTADGWRWLEQSNAGWKVEFCGSVCDQIKTGGQSDVTAKFGCPTEIIPTV